MKTKVIIEFLKGGYHCRLVQRDGQYYFQTKPTYPLSHRYSDVSSGDIALRNTIKTAALGNIFGKLEGEKER